MGTAGHGFPPKGYDRRLCHTRIPLFFFEERRKGVQGG